MLLNYKLNSNYIKDILKQPHSGKKYNSTYSRYSLSHAYTRLKYSQPELKEINTNIQSISISPKLRRIMVLVKVLPFER